MTEPSQPSPLPDPALASTPSPSGTIGPSNRPALGAGRKYGPMAVILIAVLALVGYVAATSPVDRPADSATGTSAPPDRGAASTADLPQLPDGVETFARATALGTVDDIEWGDRCDTEIGRVAMPIWPQPECFAPFGGDNGAATATGVTADSIKVVLYQPQSNDPVLKFIYAQIGNSDSTDDVFATFEGFAQIFNRYYELYGRRVELVRYSATGSISDPAAATADAETIARDLQPFAVVGGPQLTNAFADTLARNQVLCIACSPGQPAQWYVDRAPYVWDVQRNADQGLQMVAEYIGKRLAKRPAKYAGDAALHDTERVFGYIHVVSSDSSQELEDRFTAILADEYDTEFARIQTYALPTELAGSGKDIITAMKEAGVTTIVFSGDPLAPQTLTRIATEQEYFPEWVLGVATLVDTAVFSRTYDQRQWAHAFGPSPLFARSRPGTAGPGFLYRWYFDTDAPAIGTVPLIAGPLQVLFGALQGMGPEVTHEHFQRALFAGPIIESTPISAQVSFGDRGVFPDPDFAGLDDQTEIWWDPDAGGSAELGAEGTGMWRFVNGGERVLLGDWPETEPVLFDDEGTVTTYDKPPRGTELPDYRPLS